MSIVMVGPFPGPFDRTHYSDSSGEHPTGQSCPPEARAPALRQPGPYLGMLHEQEPSGTPGTLHDGVAYSAVMQTDIGAPPPAYIPTWQEPQPETPPEPPRPDRAAPSAKSKWDQPRPEGGPVVAVVIVIVAVVVVVDVVVTGRDDRGPVADDRGRRAGGAARSGATRRRRLDAVGAAHRPDDVRTNADIGGRRCHGGHVDLAGGGGGGIQPDGCSRRRGDRTRRPGPPERPGVRADGIARCGRLAGLVCGGRDCRGRLRAGGQDHRQHGPARGDQRSRRPHRRPGGVGGRPGRGCGARALREDPAVAARPRGEDRVRLGAGQRRYGCSVGRPGGPATTAS
ncbi:uncharacterized protein LOC142557101 isoform X3 [Dermacentor variabilis]|uniref:uncharacterized protein LOC142557101 isoform X3 n=1 Tax=Dermacentor variabilis TaxID=34621 RepID=UPI003F5BE584